MMLDLYALTVANGGGTFLTDGTPLEPKPGRDRYVVGTEDGTALTVPVDDPAAFWRALYELAATRGGTFGTWVDDGTIHIDPVEVVEDRWMAERYGRRMNQLAIYALDRGETIRLAA